MTQKETLKQVRATGCTVTVSEGEYRILPYKGAPEAQAYYTDDREDAVNTAHKMRE